MPIMISRRGVLGDLQKDLARLESLTAEFRRIASGDMLPPASLDEAPLLENYRLGKMQTLCLTGDCADHPLIGDTFIKTSAAWIIAPDYGWARTFSRFYRLGTPAGPVTVP